MRRGTTPVLSIKVKDADVNDFGTIYVTFKQGDKELTKINGQFTVDTENNVINVPFTQEDTLLFDKGYVETELRVILKDNTTVIASKIRKFPMEKVLLDGVINVIDED